jgi:hypothetical protein
MQQKHILTQMGLDHEQIERLMPVLCFLNRAVRIISNAHIIAPSSCFADINIPICFHRLFDSLCSLRVIRFAALHGKEWFTMSEASIRRIEWCGVGESNPRLSLENCILAVIRTRNFYPCNYIKKIANVRCLLANEIGLV